VFKLQKCFLEQNELFKEVDPSKANWRSNFEVFLAQMEMESPELKKVVFLGVKKRL